MEDDILLRVKDGKLGTISHPEDGSYFEEESNQKENIEIMQFTGLKDKNGKEIYEGDIVRINEFHNFEIIYKDGCYWLKGDDGELYYRLEHWIRIANEGRKRLEVAGNKFENPELLK